VKSGLKSNSDHDLCLIITVVMFNKGGDIDRILSGHEESCAYISTSPSALELLFIYLLFHEFDCVLKGVEED
jgi:hypothetical protein